MQQSWQQWGFCHAQYNPNLHATPHIIAADIIKVYAKSLPAQQPTLHISISNNGKCGCFKCHWDGTAIGNYLITATYFDHYIKLGHSSLLAASLIYIQNGAIYKIKSLSFIYFPNNNSIAHSLLSLYSMRLFTIIWQNFDYIFKN